MKKSLAVYPIYLGVSILFLLILFKLNKKPLLGNFIIIIYLLYLANLERKDKTAKIVIFTITVFLALLFYSYYFV